MGKLAHFLSQDVVLLVGFFPEEVEEMQARNMPKHGKESFTGVPLRDACTVAPGACTVLYSLHPPHRGPRCERASQEVVGGGAQILLCEPENLCSTAEAFIEGAP